MTERRKNANNEWVNETHWFNLIAWGAVASRVESNVRKGQQIAIEGSLRNNEWTDDKGQRHSSVEIWVKDFLMMSPAKE